MTALDFPNNPAVDDEYTSDGGTTWVWDGEKWVLPSSETGGGGGSSGASVTLSDTPPSNPSEGDLWWDTVGGQLYVWYDDGDSQQWAATSTGSGGDYLPLIGGTLTGDLYGTNANFSGSVTLNPDNDTSQSLYIGSQTYIHGSLTVNGGASFVGSGDVGFYSGSVGFGAPATFYQSVTINNTLSVTGVATFTPAVVFSGGIRGATDNTSGYTGTVGEFLSVNISTAVSLVNSTAVNIGSLSLSAGDWDVYGSAYITGASMTNVVITLGTAPAALPPNPWVRYQLAGLTIGTAFAGPAPPQRFSSGSAMTIYLIGWAAFASGSVTATGNIWARRAR